MRFGEVLRNAMKRLLPFIPEEKWIDYEMLKVSIDEADEMTFWHRWEQQLDKVNSYLDQMLRGTQEITKIDCGHTLSCACYRKNNIKGEHLDVLFKYVELNREGFRKIAKKHDKVKRSSVPQQQMRLQTFDNRVMSAVEELETRAFFNTVIEKTERTRIIGALLFFLVTMAIALAAIRPPKNTTLLVLAAVGGFATAFSNAANDICNCVGTLVGAQVLTMRQAIFWGCVFEVIGCVALGSQVAKNITKGIIDTSNYTEDPQLFAFSMVCVLFGAGSTTLLATAYGLPISATHGIIGGLVAVGMAGKGPSSIGWSKVGVVGAGWVASPFVGGFITFSMTLLIHFLIKRHEDPAQRSRSWQPLFLFICFSVNTIFMLLKGAKFLEVKPAWKAILVALGAGALLTAFYLAIVKLTRKWQGGVPCIERATSLTDGLELEKHTSEDKSTSDLRESSSERGDVERALHEMTPLPTKNQAVDPAPRGNQTDLQPEDDAAKQARDLSDIVKVELNEPSENLTRPEPQFDRLKAGDEDKASKRDVSGSESRDSVVECPPELEGDELAERVKKMNSFAWRSNTMFQDNPVLRDFLKERSVKEVAGGNPTEAPFNFPLILSGLSLALAHGGNDVGNAVGPFAAVLAVVQTGQVEEKPDPPIWTLLVGAIAFLLGILTIGQLTIKTVGTKITRLTASKSFSVQIGAAVAVLGSSALGLPVSTSHCLVGSVVGGAVGGRLVGKGSVNKKVLFNILKAWLATIPLAMAIAIFCFAPFQNNYA